MKRALLILGLLAGSSLAVSPALAQMVYLHGGAGFPSSSAFNAAYQPGFNVGFGVGVPITSRFEGVIRGSYDRFGLDSDVDGNDFTSYSATANMKVNGPSMNERLMPYALGGAGIFRLGVENAFETDFGLQFGAGFGIQTSPRVNLMIEPNYVLVLNEGENMQYFPIRLGASFSL